MFVPVLLLAEGTAPTRGCFSGNHFDISAILSYNFFTALGWHRIHLVGFGPSFCRIGASQTNQQYFLGIVLCFGSVRARQCIE